MGIADSTKIGGTWAESGGVGCITNILNKLGGNLNSYQGNKNLIQVIKVFICSFGQLG